MVEDLVWGPETRARRSRAPCGVSGFGFCIRPQRPESEASLGGPKRGGGAVVSFYPLWITS